MFGYRGRVTIVVVNHSLSQVVTGLSEKAGTRRFLGDSVMPAGRADEGDVNKEAVTFARHILGEQGLSESGVEILFRVPVRSPKKQSLKSKYIPVTQYFFVAVMKEGIMFPLTRGALLGLDDLKFVHIPEALASWMLEPGTRVFKDGNNFTRKGGNVNRLNPFHALGLGEALILLREALHGKREGNGFRSMLATLPEYGVMSLEACIEEIKRAMIEQRV